MLTRKKGPEKQEMIYKVMERIINQEIPEVVINNPDYEWAPFSNKVTKGSEPVEVKSEPDIRYSHIIDIFRAQKAIDAYNPEMNTAILRKFSWEMEISQEEVESLFDSYLRSPGLVSLGKIIRERLGRDLRPFDIWSVGTKHGRCRPASQAAPREDVLDEHDAAEEVRKQQTDDGRRRKERVSSDSASR